MFRDKYVWPTKINNLTAESIILNAIEEYIGGEALNSQMEPTNPKTVQAMKDLEALHEILWKKGRKWFELTLALEERINAKKNYLESMKKRINSKEVCAS